MPWVGNNQVDRVLCVSGAPETSSYRGPTFSPGSDARATSGRQVECELELGSELIVNDGSTATVSPAVVAHHARRQAPVRVERELAGAAAVVVVS